MSRETAVAAAEKTLRRGARRAPFRLRIADVRRHRRRSVRAAHDACADLAPHGRPAASVQLLSSSTGEVLLQTPRVSAASLLAGTVVALSACVGTRAPRVDEERTPPAIAVASDATETLLQSACDSCGAASATASGRPRVEDDVVQLGDGARRPTSLLDLLSEFAEKSHSEVVLDDACRRRLGQTRVFICGTHTIRRRDLEEWMTAVLSFNHLALVPLDSRPTDDRPRWTCVDRRPTSEQQHPTELERGR